nr:MAG TPA: hypothetical protein [Caudoviricetes sp.]
MLKHPLQWREHPETNKDTLSPSPLVESQVFKPE